jgi:hypothetical protein
MQFTGTHRNRKRKKKRGEIRKRKGPVKERRCTGDIIIMRNSRKRKLNKIYKQRARTRQKQAQLQ